MPQDYYTGSKLLEGLSTYTSLEVDQINFVTSQILALGIASLYRTVLLPTKVSPIFRHLFGLVFGLWMGYFCFGLQAIHLVGLPAICYVLILTLNPDIMHGAVLFTAMLYLSLIHLHRQFLDESTYSLDISGPLMVITQKVTSLAFSLHDGLVKNEDTLTEMQKNYAIKKLPNVVEYFSYTLMFPSLMAGPVIFYTDYIDFIENHSLNTYSNNQTITSNQHTIVRDPNPMPVVIKKVTLTVICALAFVLILPMYPISRIKEEDFIHLTFVYKFWYLIMATSLVRAKYYFAWTLADAICNNAGLGWNGIKWNKYSNVDIIHFEFGTNLKQSIDSWNKGTNLWLRFIVYKRLTTYSTFFTFALSAIWHGFYPGYYLTFFSGALFTFASRTIRRNFRKNFTSSNKLKLFYDVITFTVTRLVMAYITFPFILLEFWSSIIIYNEMYWILHIFGLLAIYVVPHLIQNDESNPDKMVQKNGFTLAFKNGGPYTNAVGKID